jgi:hypothetical protein
MTDVEREVTARALQGSRRVRPRALLILDQIEETSQFEKAAVRWRRRITIGDFGAGGCSVMTFAKNYCPLLPAGPGRNGRCLSLVSLL